MVELYQENISINVHYMKDTVNSPIQLRNTLNEIELKENWPNANLIYTNGSKINGKVGAAYFCLKIKIIN